jgi:hypothetical protein
MRSRRSCGKQRCQIGAVMTYPETFITDLKSRVLVSDVVSRTTKLKRDGKEFRAVDNPSLTVNDAKGIWRDFSTNEGGDVLAWLQRSQGLSFGDAVAEIASMAGVPLPNGDGGARQPQQQLTTKSKITATYDYTDADGALLYQVVRYEPKDFRQRRPDGNGGWIWNVGERRVPYRWPELLGFPDATVFVCEGEKDADRVASLGHCATTVAAGKWTDDCVQALAGRDIIILQDHDDAGVKKAEAAAIALHGKAQTLRVVLLPDLKAKGDVSDWLDAGHSSEELVAVSLAALEWRSRGPPRITSLPPLSIDDWRNRDLPEPDFVMGHWLTTTSRMLITAATGIGKTNFGLALGMRVVAGMEFLHWQGRRKARVLYIDGEMSRRLLRQRVLDEERRVGITPENFFALSREDIEGFKPLNTIEGQAWMDALIERVGGVDLVIADNIMCLTVGDMKDPEPWQQTMPWVLSLTKRTTGQLWIHHTGHDESRSYGDKTREWGLDTVAHFDEVKRHDTDVSFNLQFKKARERTPATRFDFQDVKIALIDDRWEYELTDTRRPGKVSPQTQKALDALVNVLAGDDVMLLSGGRRAARRAHWEAECALLGLVDKDKPHSARTLFSKFRRELVAANRVACEGDWSWLL